jgi:hypothetical protein
MIRLLAVTAVAATVSAGLAPSGGEASSCVGPVSSATAFRVADLVFVGTVAKVDQPRPLIRRNADGSITVSTQTDEPRLTTFKVVRAFRGAAEPQVVIAGKNGMSGDINFKEGETWLVYAKVRDGVLAADSCLRTRLRAAAEASQDMVYLEGRERGSQQGVVFGNVHRRILDVTGKPALQALFEPLEVIASGPAGRFRVITDTWGPYQLVLPPGDFEIWVERGGISVAPRQTIKVEHGSERSFSLVADYKD